MFESDLDELDTTALLAAAAEYAQTQEHAAVGILRTALAFADRNAVVEWLDGEPLPGYERLRVYGGQGCPGVAEFAPIEFGAVLGMSSGAASSLIGEALALRHRLPRVWAAVLAGNAVAWRARKIAHACLSLSVEAAAIVDRRVAGIVNTVTPGALAKIVTAAVWQADPAQAQAQAEAAAKERGVFVAQSEPGDDHGTKRFWVRAASGDVIRFDATINDLAHALKTLGDTDTLDQRRAKAIGWIADPAAAHHLLQVARHLARTQQTPAEQAHPTQPAHPTEPAQPTSALRHPPNRPGPADRADQDCGAPSAPEVAEGAGAAWDEAFADEQPVADEEPMAYDDALAYDEASVYEEALAYDVAVDDSVGDGEVFTRLALADTLQARLAAIKHDAHSNGLGAGTGRRSRHTLYVHLTDTTLATGTGVLRVEDLGPLLATQLTELLGHDQIVIKPVIDLHDQVNVHAYEIPDRIRERVRLRHPVDMFPYSGTEATTSMDQDHITPYDRTGPPCQTNTNNLIPQGRLHHRAKTHGRWRNRRLPNGAIEWISPHGYRFHVDHTGTRTVAHPRTGGGGSPRAGL